MNCGKMYKPPFEEDNKIELEESRKAVIFQSIKSSACSIQGTYPEADKVDGFGIEKKFINQVGGKQRPFII